MTPKQKLFCEYYLTKYYGNATQSAIHAGYSKKTAYSQGQRLLKNVEIIKYMSKLKAELLEEMKNDHYDTIKKHRMISDFNVKKILDETGNIANLESLPDDVTYCVEQIETIIKKDGEEYDTVKKLKFESKTKSLSELAKIQRLYEDNVQTNINYIITVGEDED